MLCKCAGRLPVNIAREDDGADTRINLFACARRICLEQIDRFISNESIAIVGLVSYNLVRQAVASPGAGKRRRAQCHKAPPGRISQ